MINLIENPQMLLSQFKVPKDTRGYLYIARDRAFPEFVKVGRTNDLQKRLQAYNGDKPIKSTEMMYVSPMLEDVLTAEELLVQKINQQIEPTTLKHEWFEACHLGFIIDKFREVCSG